MICSRREGGKYRNLQDLTLDMDSISLFHYPRQQRSCKMISVWSKPACIRKHAISIYRSLKKSSKNSEWVHGSGWQSFLAGIIQSDDCLWFILFNFWINFCAGHNQIYNHYVLVLLLIIQLSHGKNSELRSTFQEEVQRKRVKK